MVQSRTIFTAVIAFLLLFTPIAVGFYYDWLFVFGICSFLHFGLQILFSLLNKYNDIKLKKFKLTDLPSVGIQITGWREDPELFRSCLISLKRVEYKNIKYITLASDGNDEDDKYMGEIFLEVFSDNSIVVNLEKKCIDMTSEEQKTLFDMISGYTYIAFLYPHHGKREGMYLQMKNFIQQKVDYILLTDSDTIFEADSVTELVKCAKYYDSQAVTGEVCIYNPVNFLSYLISLRYWSAFNLERASQSWWGDLNCISGPFGLYRLDIIEKIIEEWRNQTFLGLECTYGDDRNMTNLSLKYDARIYYTSNAKCYTDTPTTMTRYISQQIRWSKSFFREYIIQLGHFKLRQFYTFYDISYMMYYPFYLSSFMIWTFVQFNMRSFLLFFFSIIMISYIRSLYSFILTRNFNHFIYSIYGLIYFLSIMPLKFYAGFSMMYDNSWGTSNRKNKTYNYNNLLIVLFWNIFVFSSFGYSIYLKHDYLLEQITTHNYTNFDMILFLSLIMNVLVLILLYFCLGYTHRVSIKQKLDLILTEKTDTEIIIVSPEQSIIEICDVDSRQKEPTKFYSFSDGYIQDDGLEIGFVR